MGTPHIEVRGLTMAYGDYVIQRDLNFTINRGDIFVIMGGSGCGKSTLLRQMIGLHRPAKGAILYNGVDYWAASAAAQAARRQRFGVLFQAGALWSSLTLALVGLAGYERFYPAEISGGMKKRAGLARAIALDPEILFFDEPSAGLDPLSSRRLDDLILELRETLGSTVVLVTHELPSIFAIANDAVFLDADTRTMIAQGNPQDLLREGPEKVRHFLSRGAT